MTFFETVFAPANVFVWHPERALLVASAFFATFFVVFKIRRQQTISLLIAGFFWVAFSLWELLATIRRWDIRVDLLLLWPLLIVISSVAIVAFLFDAFKSEKA